MMRYAIYFEDEYVYAAGGAGEKDTQMLLNFKKRPRLRAHFQIVEGRLRLADSQEDANVLLRSTDNSNVMTFSVTATDDTKLEDGHARVSEALFLLCERFAESISDPGASDIVFIGSFHPSLRDAGKRAGFGSIDWMEKTDAAIREWQWASPETASSASDVVVLIYSEKGLAWEKREASSHGDFVIIPDTETRSYGGFGLTGTENLTVGIKRFLDWLQRIDGSYHIVISGSRGATLSDAEFVSAFEMQGQEVFVSDLVSGGARPAFRSKFATFDAAVSRSLYALKTAFNTENLKIRGGHTRAAFNVAMEAYNEAAAVFDEAPDELNELRRRLRSSLLSAADGTEKEAPGKLRHRLRSATEKTEEDGYFFYQLALKLSTGDAETAEVNARLAAYCIKVGDYFKAQETALSAHFFDPLTYPDIIAETACGILNQKRRQSL